MMQITTKSNNPNYFNVHEYISSSIPLFPEKTEEQVDSKQQVSQMKVRIQ